MNSEEYDRMAAVEQSHWWYTGLRQALEAVLRRADPQRALQSGIVIDAGCGTGANLKWLQDYLKPAQLIGFDISARAVELSRAAVPAAKVVQADLCSDPLPVPAGPVDLVVCSDVLYTTGTEAALPGLQRLCEQLRRGGLFLLHLPAFNWLYSDHDVAVHTRWRYRRPEVFRILSRLGLESVLVSYRMCLLFPLVVLTRLPSIFRLRGRYRSDEHASSDLRVPARLISNALGAVLNLENRWLSRGGRFPFGSSLIAVGRKR